MTVAYNDITLIWVRAHGATWVYSAWDEGTLEENYDGFKESLDKAVSEYGAECVRQQIVRVPWGRIDDLFTVPTTDCKVKDEAPATQEERDATS